MAGKEKNKMEKKDFRRAGKYALAMAMVLFMLGGFCLGFAGTMEDDYRYRWDEDYHNAVTIFKVIGWATLIGGVVDMVQAIVYIGQADAQDKAKRETDSQRDKNIYLEGMYYMEQPATMENLQAAYRCFIKIPQYQDAEWKAKKCRLMLEKMEEEQEAQAHNQ